MALVRLSLLTVFLAGSALADNERAHVNYMLHCQGCHLPEAQGFEGKVPPMKDFVGYFLHSGEGRDFLIRVPGVAQSALDDGEVAELMNWLLVTFSAKQLPDRYVPFTDHEVASLRQDPIRDPATSRELILNRLSADIPVLAAERQQKN